MIDYKGGDDTISDRIKQTIEKFKTENGNVKLPNSDMLMYLVARMDDLPCAEHLGDIKKLQATMKSWIWFAGILVTINFSLVIGTLWLVISK